MKKWVLFGVGGLLLVGLGVGGAMLLMKPSAPMTNAEGASLPPVVAAARPVHYYSLKPEFVVNFQETGRGKPQFMMVEMSIATHDEDVLEVIENHMPELRNDLLMLLAEQKSEVLATPDGKSALRENAIAAVDSVVAKYHGAERVDDVYLTRFVMQ